MTGDLAKTNPFRFSTKYQDDETDLLYYGYRYYNASTGRWLSRDPIGERGGLNLFTFIGNDPIGALDHLGLSPIAALGPFNAGSLNGPRPFPNEMGFFDAAYAWFFDGSDVHVDFKNYDPGWGPEDFPNFWNAVADLCKRCGESRAFTDVRTRDLYELHQGALGTILVQGAPGRYNVVIDGVLVSSGEQGKCSWAFSGTISAPPDRINFDPESSGRTWYAQVITWATSVVDRIPGVGRDFWLHFDGSRSVDAVGVCCGGPNDR